GGGLRSVLDTVDPVWERVRTEAEDVVRREPELATFIYASVLHQPSLEAAIVQRLAERLDHADFGGEMIRQAYADALDDDPSLGQAFRADIMAVGRPHPGPGPCPDPGLLLQGVHRH